MDANEFRRTGDFSTFVATLNKRESTKKKKELSSNQQLIVTEAQTHKRKKKLEKRKADSSQRNLQEAMIGTPITKNQSEIKISTVKVTGKRVLVASSSAPTLARQLSGGSLGSLDSINSLQSHEGSIQSGQSRALTGTSLITPPPTGEKRGSKSEAILVPSASEDLTEVDEFRLNQTVPNNGGSILDMGYPVSPPLTAPAPLHLRWGAGFSVANPEPRAKPIHSIPDKSKDMYKRPPGLPELKPRSRNGERHISKRNQSMSKERKLMEEQNAITSPFLTPRQNTPLPVAPAPPQSLREKSCESKPESQSSSRVDGDGNVTRTVSVKVALNSVASTASSEKSPKDKCDLQRRNSGNTAITDKVSANSSMPNLEESNYSDLQIIQKNNRRMDLSSELILSSQMASFDASQQSKPRNRYWASGFNPSQRRPKTSSDIQHSKMFTDKLLAKSMSQLKVDPIDMCGAGLPMQRRPTKTFVRAQTPPKKAYLKMQPDIYERRRRPKRHYNNQPQAGKMHPEAYFNLGGIADHIQVMGTPKVKSPPPEMQKVAPTPQVSLEEGVKKPDEQEQSKFYLGVATDLMKQKRYKDALEACHRVLHHDEHSVTGLITRASCYNRTNQYYKAVEDASLAIKLHSTGEQGYLERAEAHISLQQWDLAISDANKALILNPESTTAYHHRAVCHIARLRWDTALKDVEKLLAKNPKAVAARIMRSEINRALNQWQKVVIDCTTLLQVRGEHQASTACRRAEAYIRLGNYDMAISDCSKCLKQNPDIPQAYAYRGEAFFQLGFHKYATADFETYRNLTAYANTQSYHTPMRVWRHLWREW